VERGEAMITVSQYNHIEKFINRKSDLVSGNIKSDFRELTRYCVVHTDGSIRGAFSLKISAMSYRNRLRELSGLQEVNVMDMETGEIII
jgi:hypothetical protein